MPKSEISKPYVLRRQDRAAVEAVRRPLKPSSKSRVLLVYGEGGIGKTELVRNLQSSLSHTSRIQWVEPIDLDDPQYWLLSNLERRVAASLDPSNRFFGDFQRELLRSPEPESELTPHEEVLSYLRGLKRTFASCYKEFVEASDRVPVLTFDTIEVIRGTHLLLTLTQWIKALPGTVFILPSRPFTRVAQVDPIQAELRDPHQPVEVEVIQLTGFNEEETGHYLSARGVRDALDERDQELLFLLTGGHPLWLALAVQYLQNVGIPDELRTETPMQLDLKTPTDGIPVPGVKELREDLKRRLLTPYKSTDFWHDAIKRLAVLRQSLDIDSWRTLMSPLQPPGDLSWSEAWETLQSMPWVRVRSNGRQVTLHDVLAEELAWRVIPLSDQDGSWSNHLWSEAARLYADMAEMGSHDRTGLADIDTAIQEADESISDGLEESLVGKLAELDVQERSRDQALAAELHFRLMLSPPQGAQLFIDKFDGATRENKTFRQELLVLEMQRMLPTPTAEASLSPGELRGVGHFRKWLRGRPEFLEIGMRVAGYLTATGQAEDALALLESLPTDRADVLQMYRLYNRLGNARMRVEDQVGRAEEDFKRGLEICADLNASSRVRRKVEAHKELGYYYRNIGRWKDAEKAYGAAYLSMPKLLPSEAAESEREELASVYTNWAYVKALSGDYQHAEGLVDSAISIRRDLVRELGLGISLSVRGEILRYGRRFLTAWHSYEEAREIFQYLGSWYWLGQIHQQQAICLFQADKAGFTPTIVPSPVAEARNRITWALDLCGDLNLRAYPSALNRAGRIFGDSDIDLGLQYLAKGIDEARRIVDGWFLCANLVEYGELRHRRWLEHNDELDLSAIRDKQSQVESALEEFSFDDLTGRWMILKGYLVVAEAQANDSPVGVRDAVHLVGEGLGMVARSQVGSHGAASIPEEFTRLRTVLATLDAGGRERWYRALEAMWGNSTEGTATLMARLQELYLELHRSREG